MQKFQTFNQDVQAKIASKVAGYVDFIVRKTDPTFSASGIYLDRIIKWLFNDNVPIDPNTLMIPHGPQTTKLFKVVFNQR